MVTVLIHVCKCVCVHCGSVSSSRDGPSPWFVLEKLSPHSLWLDHTIHSRSWFSFSAQVQSPQTLAIQTCRRSRMVLLWFKKFGICIKRRENERTSSLYMLNSAEAKFLHSLDPPYRKTGKCSLRHSDTLWRWKMNIARWQISNYTIVPGFESSCQ